MNDNRPSHPATEVLHTADAMTGAEPLYPWAVAQPPEDDAVALARYGDPSRSRPPWVPSPLMPVQAEGPGVVWVRLTDLMAGAAGRLAGNGISLQSDLLRRSRAGAARMAGQRVGPNMGRIHTAVTRAGIDRASRLPGVDAFGSGRGCRPGRSSGRTGSRGLLR